MTSGLFINLTAMKNLRPLINPTFVIFVAEENFVTAVHILNTWLERGDCSKRNVSQFYTLIQCANARIRNLQSEKQTGEEEIERVKMRYKQLLETILQQCKY